MYVQQLLLNLAKIQKIAQFETRSSILLSARNVVKLLAQRSKQSILAKMLNLSILNFVIDVAKKQLPKNCARLILMLNRYIKNTQALSEKECSQLQNKRVCVVGCGGLGGYVISNLARIGVENLTIVDYDVFDETNLNRQIFSNENNLGKAKVDVIKENLDLINSRVKISSVKEKLTKDNASFIIKNHDCVVDCLDNFEARF